MYKIFLGYLIILSTTLFGQDKYKPITDLMGQMKFEESLELLDKTIPKSEDKSLLYFYKGAIENQINKFRSSIQSLTEGLKFTSIQDTLYSKILFERSLAYAGLGILDSAPN